MNDNYDCIVVGGGPAGATTAALVAEAGHSTLLLEREEFPRFHVGESLMPEAYWVFERLGIVDKLRSSNFVKKVSVQFVSHTGAESQPFYFEEHDPRECSQTWQVERSQFDQLLFETARERGAECHDGTRVLDVLMQDGRATGVRCQSAEGEPREVRAQVVVDATGQQAVLANRLGLKVENPDLKKAAIWGYYQDAHREPGDHGGATIILQTEGKQSWFWYIPLQQGITSVGVVGDRDHLLKRGGSPAEVFQEELAKCPALQKRLEPGELTSDLRTLKEFSYSTTQPAGDGWVLVGDAWGFIDPIYSSGVYFALRSGELAADAIIEGLAKGDTSAAQLGQWADDFGKGTTWIRKLVRAFYSDDFSFGRFLRDHPQHVGNLTDLLIGRIFYDGAGRIFDDMDPELAKTSS